MTRDERIVQYIPLVYQRARAIAAHIHWRHDHDDMIGDGMIGLIYAADHFDATKSAFITYAWRCIEHRICSGMRARSPLTRTQQAAGMTAEHVMIEAVDVVEDELVVQTRDTRIDVKTAIKALSPRHQRVIAHVYYKGGMLKDALPNRSRGNLNEVHQAALKKLRTGILKEYSA